MIPINFNTTHFGFFKNTSNWQQLCRDITMKPYVADFKEQPTDFFIQRFLIQAIILECKKSKENKFKKMSVNMLINENLSFAILKYFSMNDIFKFNVVRNIILTVIKNKLSIIEILQKDANSYALNKQLILNIPIKENQNHLIKI